MQPFSTPTGQPSSSPTTAKQLELTVEVSQLVRLSSRARFIADPKAAEVFKVTVAKSVPGLQPYNVEISNVTDVVFDANAPPPEGIGFLSRINVLDIDQPNMVRGILILYKIIFVAQRLVVQNSDPDQAHQILASSLTNVARTGSFTSSIRSLAEEVNSTAFLDAQAEPGSIKVSGTFAFAIVRSARPTSQPSSAPSGQPTGGPSGQPTAVPSLSMETRWRDEVDAVYEQFLTEPQPHRTSYFAAEVSGSALYGSCNSWNNYLMHSLAIKHRSKVVSSIALLVEVGEVESAVTVISCDESAVAQALIDALASPFTRRAARLSFTCGAHQWMVQDCSFVKSGSPSTAGQAGVSRAVCVNCNNPCHDYDCGSHMAAAVLSPCTRVASCPYLNGSMQILSTHYSPRGDSGHTTVLLLYGALWGSVIVSMLVVSALIYFNLDLKFMRSAPPLLCNQGSLLRVAKIVPLPAVPSSHSTTQHPEAAEVERMQNLVTPIFDWLLVAARPTSTSSTTALPGQAPAKTQRFWYRMMSYNRYLAPFTRSSHRERLVHSLSILTRITWIFFCVALCFSLHFTDDDESCYFKKDFQQCGEKKNLFNLNDKYCAWVGVSSGDDGGQPLHQAQCLWGMYSAHAVTMLNMAIVTIITTCIPRIFYTNLLVNSVILAPDEPNSSIFAHRHHPHRHRRRSISQWWRASRQVGVSPSDVTDNASSGATNLQMFGIHLSGPILGKEHPEHAILLFRSFMLAFTSYRNTLMLRDDDQARQFEAEWQASNLYIWNFSGSLADLSSTSEESGEEHAQQQAVVTELVCVCNQGDKLAPLYKELLQRDADQFASCLLMTFFFDLLGKSSIQCRLVRSMLSELLQDNAYFREIGKAVKLSMTLFIVASNMCLVYGTILLLSRFSERSQRYWIVCGVITMLVDAAIVDNVEALWFRWVLPLCVADALVKLRQIFTEVIREYKRTDYVAAASSSSSSEVFSMPSYQFLSSNIAHRLPNHVASRVVLSYHRAFPRTITEQKWPSARSSSPTEYGAESIGYVLFSRTGMWLAVLTPTFLQQILLTGFTCLFTWLAASMLLEALSGDYYGVLLAGVVVTFIAMIYVSYHIPWNKEMEVHPGEENNPFSPEPASRKVEPEVGEASANDLHLPPGGGGDRRAGGTGASTGGSGKFYSRIGAMHTPSERLRRQPSHEESPTSAAVSIPVETDNPYELSSSSSESEFQAGGSGDDDE